MPEQRRPPSSWPINTRSSIPPFLLYRQPSTAPSIHLSSEMSSPKQTHPTEPELVEVDTALTVLSQVNLLRESNSLAIDIGGSLAKLIYLQHHDPTKPRPPPLKIHRVDGTVATALSVHVPALRGTLHFFAFESRNISHILRFIRQHWAHTTTRRKIRATGGGSYKYENNFQSEIGVTLVRLDEMKATVAGLNFLLTSIKNEVYAYSPPPDRNTKPAREITRVFVDTTDHPFPYLLVNIGSGVSIVKVTGHDQFERVSGSSLGGGTFWGLARMLLDCATFDEIIELTHEGDNRNVDMLVGDIYGGAYQSIGLDSNIIAASFGKATTREEFSRHPTSAITVMKERFVRACVGSYHLWMSFLLSLPVVGTILRALSIGTDSERPPTLSTHSGDRYRPQDVALSLLRMVSYNIGQIAYLNARVHNLDRIYFGGNFIRNHPFTIADISFAVDFWSGGKTQALFLRHDGYLGAIGAFIGGSSAAPTKVIDEDDVPDLPTMNGEVLYSEEKPIQLKNRKFSDAEQPQEAADLEQTSTNSIATSEKELPDDFQNSSTDSFARTTEKKEAVRRRKKKLSSHPASHVQDGVAEHLLNSERIEQDYNEMKSSESDGDWTTVKRSRHKAATKRTAS